MLPNFLFIALAALVPLVIGFIWYNPKTFGNAWMKSAGVTEETMQGANMALIFGLTYIFSFFIALILFSITVHQTHIYSTLMNEPGFMEAGTPANDLVKDFMDKFGNQFRTFGHGALHGTIAGILLAMPVLAVNALFERKGFKYIAINSGFWIVCLAIMGGIVCQFA